MDLTCNSLLRALSNDVDLDMLHGSESSNMRISYTLVAGRKFRVVYIEDCVRFNSKISIPDSAYDVHH